MLFELFKSVLHILVVHVIISEVDSSRKINTRRGFMAISYKRLWKLLIDRNMYKKDLRIAAGLSTNVIQ